MGALDRVQRGVDSSGRPLVLTRQHWQFIDRLNAGPGKGKLVVIQGSFRGGSGADASGDTHDNAGSSDIRRWNLTSDEAYAVKKASRDPQQVGGGSMWERTAAQGFDSHFHNTLVGDRPGSPGSLAQEAAYIAGYNGLGSGYRGYRDDFWRPATITAYKFLEDEITMAEAAEIKDAIKASEERILARIGGAEGRERDRDFRMDEKNDQALKDFKSAVFTEWGKQADELTLLANATKDVATRKELRKMQAKILRRLKDDPAVDGADNPSDEAVAEAESLV